jgi:hypothetical protein
LVEIKTVCIVLRVASPSVVVKLSLYSPYELKGSEVIGSHPYSLFCECTLHNTPQTTLYIIIVFSPTDAQLDSLKNNIKFALKLT